MPDPIAGRLEPAGDQLDTAAIEIETDNPAFSTALGIASSHRRPESMPASSGAAPEAGPSTAAGFPERPETASAQTSPAAAFDPNERQPLPEGTIRGLSQRQPTRHHEPPMDAEHQRFGLATPPETPRNFPASTSSASNAAASTFRDPDHPLMSGSVERPPSDGSRRRRGTLRSRFSDSE